jgi:hypothetical protein
MSEMTKERLRWLAESAVLGILTRTTVLVTRDANCEREGFPLPIKRNKMPNPDGTITQEYRPMAILEYVDDVLSGELAARKARDRKAEKDSAAAQIVARQE